MLSITDLGVKMRQAISHGTRRAKSGNLQRKAREGTTEARFWHGAAAAATMAAVAMLLIPAVTASEGSHAARLEAETTMFGDVHSRQGRQNGTACEVADFVPIIPQMPEGCADMIMAAASTGAMPSSEAMCRCIAAVEVADLPGCGFGGVIFDPATHASCVAMVDAGTAPPTSAPAMSQTVALPICTTVAFIPLLAQMTQLCAATMVRANINVDLPSVEVMCGCLVDADPTTLPECTWLGYSLDAAGHQECVDMVADAGGTSECFPAFNHNHSTS